MSTRTARLEELIRQRWQASIPRAFAWKPLTDGCKQGVREEWTGAIIAKPPTDVELRAFWRGFSVENGAGSALQAVEA